MDTGELIEALNTDLGAEYESIVQYIQGHVSELRDALGH